MDTRDVLDRFARTHLSTKAERGMEHGSVWGRRLPLIALAPPGVVIAGTFLGVPLGSLLILGVLLLCPLPMMRMHGGAARPRGIVAGDREHADRPGWGREAHARGSIVRTVELTRAEPSRDIHTKRRSFVGGGRDMVHS